jgi:hypothetical protein
LERGFPPSIAIQTAASEFANSVYGRLRRRMPTAADVIARGTDWEEVFHGIA